MTIFRCSLLVIALSACSASADEQQNKAILQLNDRLSALEENDAVVSQAFAPSSNDVAPPSSINPFEAANKLRDEQETARAKWLAKHQIDEIDQRVKNLEIKDNQRDIREMARGAQ